MKSYLKYRSEENIKMILNYFNKPIDKVIEERLNRAFIIAEAVNKIKKGK